MKNQKVLIVQRRLTHYRSPFFEILRQQLSDRGYSLQVAYGKPTEEELDKGDVGYLPWATLLDTSYFVGGKLCWQPFGQLLEGTSMVVIGAENKLLYNLYVQMAWRDLAVALWGHGEISRRALTVGASVSSARWQDRLTGGLPIRK